MTYYKICDQPCRLQKFNEGILQILLHLQLLNELPPAARKPEHLTRNATEVALWVLLPWQGKLVKEWAYGRSSVKVIRRRSAAARTLSNNFQRGRSVSGYSRSSDNSRGPTTTSRGSLPGVSTLHGAQRCLCCRASPHSTVKRTQFQYHSNTCSHGSLPVVPWQLQPCC